MKKLNTVLLIIFIFSCIQLNAQNSQSRFSVFSYGGIGFAKVEIDNEANYNLNVNSAELLVYYRIGDRLGIATGLGFDNFSGNGFNSTGSFYHERNSLRIPLLAMYNFNVAEKVRIYGNIGLYGRNVSSEEYDAANIMTIVGTYEGWNFGLQTSIGLAYNFDENYSMGFTINNQGDFTNIDSVTTNINTGSKNQQKIKGMYTAGLSFGYNF
ncbi:hypothetical protein IMCC3317_45400 [Kordia antarctica]|uniref:Outer membrane protein beta-barrel domain-containing protein n=1 Tax=Kordia antarctica TaxID=1218801 RepID=A0A7L4ZRN2_9FLAO|nr:outer membrane beta-barrel protein [Kordia antarctica]QHI39139.1 hypothetical protein IMCC3317_45400 [Kordia antarctica]